MQTGKEKTSNKKNLTLATVLLVALLQPAVATVTITGSLSSDESASGTVYAGIVDFNADPIDWFNTFESTWVGNFSFPANLTNFQAEFFNVNVGNEYYLIVFVDQDSNGNPDTYEIGAIHGPFYLGSTNFNVGDIWLDFGGASGGGGGTGGMIEGTVGSSESTFGTVLVGLFDMPDPSDWNDRVSERNLGSQSFPNYGIWFDFQEEWIIDGDYSVVAFIDENSDQSPNEGEAVGMASVTVTGDYGYTGDITMSYGGGGGGSPNYIQVTSPNSMSNWTAGSGEPIEWNSSTSDDMDYTVDIELWKSGSYYELIDQDLQSSSSGSSFWWSIPEETPDGNDYEVRVAHFDSGVDDFSDYFQISGGGEGGFVSGNLHSEESVSGELIFGLFSPSNGGEEWDPDWWQNQYVTFPSDQYYQFDESGISDGYGYNVRAFVDANSNYSPDPEELQGKSGDFEVIDGFATNIDFDLNYEYETGGYSLEFNGGEHVETGFSAYDGGPEFTFELFFKVFYVPGTGKKFELFRREDWGILEYDGTQQKFIFGLYGIGQVEYTVSLVTDEWYHIAAEYDESNLRIYLDGMGVAAFLGGGNLPETPEDINIYVGVGVEGLIDIERMSDTGFDGGNNFDPYSNDYSAGAGVHLLWHCTEGFGTTVFDESGNGHDGLIVGAEAWNTDEPIGGFMDPQLWYTDVSSDYVMLEMDRWPDSDA